MTQQFDLFVSPDAAPEKVTGSPVMKRHSTAALNEEDMVRHLEETGRYHILKRLESRSVATAAQPGFSRRGVILDTETTGLNYRKDEIIEIGVVAFTFDEAGNIGNVIGVYSGLQQPSVSIPLGITRLTGIADEIVAGQMIDLHQLRAIVEPAISSSRTMPVSTGRSGRRSHPFLLERPGPARPPKSIGARVASRAQSSVI